jgi:hypothetical protein
MIFNFKETLIPVSTQLTTWNREVTNQIVFIIERDIEKAIVKFLVRQIC